MAAAPPTAPPPSTSSQASRDLSLAQEGLDNYADPALYAGRYRLNKQIGKGAYGAVYSATESFPAASGQAPRKVAIKHIVNAFVTPTDARRIYREIKVQAHFNPAHPNILPLLEVIKPRDAVGFTHIYLVSELMETDLHRVVHSRQDLTSDHISYFIYQTLCALQVIHAAHILHRDLKPSNLLANADCCIKMCDFGLARESDSSLSQAFTEYVVTRWYRAPEVLLSGGRYTGSIDVWSVGCILGELLLRRPLFPGEHYLHQLQLITEILGSPTEEDLAFVTAPAARTFMLNLPHSPGVPFATLFPHVRGPCLDLLRKMLIFEPSQRITVEEALEHPFLARVRAARRAISEDSTPFPKAFKLRVQGGSSALKAMTVDKLKERFYAELCGLAMTPTPSTPSPHAGAALFASLSGGGGGGGGAGAGAEIGSPPSHHSGTGGGGGVLGSLPRPTSGQATLSPPQPHSAPASKLYPGSNSSSSSSSNSSLAAAAAAAAAVGSTSTSSGAGVGLRQALPFGAAPRGLPGAGLGHFGALGHSGPPRGLPGAAAAAAGGSALGALPGTRPAMSSFLPLGVLPPPRGIPQQQQQLPLGGVLKGVGSPGTLASRYTTPAASAPAAAAAAGSAGAAAGAGGGEFLRNRYGMGVVGAGSSAAAAAAAAAAAEEEEEEEAGEEDYLDEEEEDEYDYGDIEDGYGAGGLGGIREGSKEGSFDDSSMLDGDGLVGGHEGGAAAAAAAPPPRAGYTGMFGAPAAKGGPAAGAGLLGAPRSQAQAFVAAYGAGGTSLSPPRVSGMAPSPPPGPPPSSAAAAAGTAHSQHLGASGSSLRASMASLSISNAASTPPKVNLRPAGVPGSGGK